MARMKRSANNNKKVQESQNASAARTAENFENAKNSNK